MDVSQEGVRGDVSHENADGDLGACLDNSNNDVVEHNDNGEYNDEDVENGEAKENVETLQSNVDSNDSTNSADISRQVVVKNIDKKATSDDLEDFFYDNYENIETIFRETFVSGKGANQKEVFKGSVILTFTDEESANKFLGLTKKIRYKSWKLETIPRKLFIQRKKDIEKKREEIKEKRNNDSNKADECTVVCTGFHKSASSLQEVVNYMYDNHENIIDVNMEIHRDARGFERWDTITTIIFADKKTAERFLNLSYVKFKGVYITRTSLEDYNLKKSNAKRKKTEKKYEDVLVDGASFTLRGFETNKESFDYRGAREQIKEKLVSCLKVASDDICYISFRPSDKEAIIRMKTAVGEDLANKWNETKIDVSGDKISAEVLSGEAEQNYLSKCREEILHKMERKTNYNVGKKPKGSKSNQNGNSRTSWLEDY